MIILQRRAVVDEYRQFSFQRGSVAFGSSGRLYYPHQARFESVGGRTGVMVEEGTTNLLGANGFLDKDSNGDGIADGASRYFSGGGDGVLSMDSANATLGRPRCQRIEMTSGTGYFGIRIANISGVSQPNTVSALVKVLSLDPGAKVQVYARYLDAANTFLEGRGSVIDRVQDWTWVTAPATTNPSAAKVDAYVWIVGGNGVVYVQAVQSENKAYRTSFTNGTRAAETLTVPKEVVNLTEGTVEAWALFNDVDTSHYGAIFTYGGSAPGPRLLIVRDRLANNIRVWDGDGVDEATILDSTTVVTTNTWYYVAFTWSAQGRALYVNGQKQATNTRSKPLGTPPENPKLGLWGTGNYLNGLVAMVRISRRARTDQEIADAYAAGTLTADADTTLLLPFTGPDAQRGARTLYVPAVGF